MIFIGQLLVIIGQLALPAYASPDADVRAKLAESRYALLAQLREIQRSYDDVTRQIDDLRRKQALLDSYRRETESAIAGVEHAMAQAQ